MWPTRGALIPAPEIVPEGVKDHNTGGLLCSESFNKREHVRGPNWIGIGQPSTVHRRTFAP